MIGIKCKKDPYNAQPELPKLNGGKIGVGWAPEEKPDWLEANFKWKTEQNKINPKGTWKPRKNNVNTRTKF